MGELNGRSAEDVVMAFISHWNAGELEGVSRLLAPDFERYGEETEWGALSRAGYIFWWEGYRRAFPDAHWELLDVVAGTDAVAVRLIESGTFTAPWDLGDRIVPPNHKRYRTFGVVIFKVSDGQIYRYDYLGYGRGDHEDSFLNAYGEHFTDGASTVPDISRASFGSGGAH